jgi:hypothetical protein
MDSIACLASINAGAQSVIATNGVVLTNFFRVGEERFLTPQEAAIAFRAMYGHLDCHRYGINQVPLDLWKRPIELRLTASGLKAYSAGPDGKLGTDDDISYEGSTRRPR